LRYSGFDNTSRIIGFRSAAVSSNTTTEYVKDCGFQISATHYAGRAKKYTTVEHRRTPPEEKW